jgi:hypothetical protein
MVEPTHAEEHRPTAGSPRCEPRCSSLADWQVLNRMAYPKGLPYRTDESRGSLSHAAKPSFDVVLSLCLSPGTRPDHPLSPRPRPPATCTSISGRLDGPATPWSRSSGRGNRRQHPDIQRPRSESTNATRRTGCGLKSTSIDYCDRESEEVHPAEDSPARDLALSRTMDFRLRPVHSLLLFRVLVDRAEKTP